MSPTKVNGKHYINVNACYAAVKENCSSSKYFTFVDSDNGSNNCKCCDDALTDTTSSKDSSIYECVSPSGKFKGFWNFTESLGKVAFFRFSKNNLKCN